jgi:hypothetical protein
MVPDFNEAVLLAEKKLESTLGGKVQIKIFDVLDTELVGIIESIDHTKFRSELWYDSEQLENYSKKADFVCFIVYFDGTPVAYDFGYRDSDDGSFFSDSAATLIERKGIGSILTALEMLKCYDKGFSSIKFLTEEEDEVGRRLRAYWERFGYQVTTVSQKGVEMSAILDPKLVLTVYNKFLKD